ncbi:MAG: annexin, partial [Rhodobacterales bacterium]|nr:annexin [Rhodobacterales bacterium]
LDGDVVTEAVGALYEAMDGPGTDEDTIMKMLRGKSDEERALIKAEYRRRYGVDLDADLKDEMSDHDLDRSEALLEGDTAKADAIAIDQAMHGGLFGLGTDEGQIEGVYADIRNDVAGKQIEGEDGKMRPLTAEEMEAEVAKRNSEVEAKYDARYGNPGDQESALRSAYKDELSGPDLDLANALAENDLIAADAARLEREKQGVLYADDDVINGVLENQYTRALDALKRDPKMRAEREALQETARKEGWDPYRLAQAERELDRQMEQAAREGGAANMAKLETAYDTKYSRWGKGGLDAMIVFNMSGTDREKAQALRKQGGYLSRAQRVDFATRGPGTDEEDFKRATEGLTKAEIADLNKDLAGLGRPSVDKIAEEELDGREGFDMKISLRGVPENIDEEMEQAKLRTNWELVNSPITGHERDVLENRLAKMRGKYDLIRDPNAPKAERDRALAQFRARGVGVQSAVEQYRAQVDAVTDAVATAAALVVGIAVTVATGGIAGAVLGALYAAVAGMTVKAALKGAAYGAEEMAIDAVVGIVDAAAAAATAGVGNALMRVASASGKKAGGLASTKLAATLAKMAQSSSRTQRMLAHGIAEGVEGAAGALPSALAGNVLNDKNWDGNPLANIVGGTLMETGFGFALGGGLGSLGGLKMPKPDVLPTPGGSMDLLANRGTPQDRLSAWKAHKAENPDARMGDFLQAWDKAASDRLARQADDAALQAAMRGNLMAGLPPADRKALAGFKVEILSEADFRKFTGSDSGMAVTVIENGTPRVILREGAPLSVLREEGIHLHQIADPDLGPLARRLDEARLGQWDKLTLAEKMELYAVKVDLEIDAQKKLIASLDGDIKAGRAGDPAGLSRQIADAEKALANLEKRAAEVAGMGPLDRIAMSKGLRDPPPWLDQPARLFSKDSKAPKPDGFLSDSPFPARKEYAGKGLKAVEIPQPGGKPKTDWSQIDLAEDAAFTMNIEGRGKTQFSVLDGELKMLDGGEWVDTPDGKIVDLDGLVPTFKHNGGKRVHFERTYRDVGLIDPANPDSILAIREEARNIDHGTMREEGWSESGRSIAGKGGSAEAESQLISRKLVADPGSGVVATFQVPDRGRGQELRRLCELQRVHRRFDQCRRPAGKPDREPDGPARETDANRP